VRLFVALEIPGGVRQKLAALVDSLRTISKEPRWVRPENLHVTLKFLGEVTEGKLDAVRKKLEQIRSNQTVTLEFRGLGFFPNERYPRVFWVGIEASENLKTLAADIDGAMMEFGIACEKRSFSPHLTLARIERPRLPEALRAAITTNAQREFGSLQTNEFCLIHSKLKPSGAEYTTLASFQFTTKLE